MSNVRLWLLSAAAIGLGTVLWFDMADHSTAPASSPVNVGGEPIGQSAQPRADGDAGLAPREEARGGSLATAARLGTDAVVAAVLGMRPDDFSSIVERPLFSTTRLPPAPKPKPKPKQIVVRKPPPPREPPLRVRLVGIVMGNGQRIALLRDPGSSKTMRLSTGDKVHAWRIESIGDATVQVRHKKWTRELTLFQR